MSSSLQPHDALLVVDIQRDFLPGGALGVRDGDAVVPLLNRCMAAAQGRGLPVVATRDWHPADHCSFRPQGGPWPVHCVADTPGAAFSSDLALPEDALLVYKATRRDEEAYSTFHGTGLAQRLRALGVKRVVIGGLATDYCVRNSALDALAEGFDVVVLEDAVRAVDVQPGDGARALAEVQAAGAALARSEDYAS